MATRRPNRHFFILKPARGRNIKVPTKVWRGKKRITLYLSKQHFDDSMKLRGMGDGQLCAGAFCVCDHAALFPHKVFPYVDFQDTRMWVVSRLRDGMPSECYVYDHNSIIPKTFDSEKGRDQLRAILERANVTINLYPVLPDTRGRRSGPNKGPSRKKRTVHIAREIRVEGSIGAPTRL